MHVCEKCGTKFDGYLHVCPKCGGDPIPEEPQEEEHFFKSEGDESYPFYYRVWFIVLAFIVFWPAGIVLLILRSRNPEVNKSVSGNKGDYATAKKVGGVICLIMGAVGIGNIFDAYDVSSMIADAIVGAALIILGVWLFTGGKDGSLMKRDWAKFEAVIDNRGNTRISDIAERLGMKETKTATKLQKMINNGFLRDEENGISAYINGKYDLLVMTKDGVPFVPVEDTMAEEIEKERKKSAKTPDDKLLLAIEETLKTETNDDMKDFLKRVEHSVININKLIKQEPSLAEKKSIVNLKNSYIPQAHELLDKYERSTTSDEMKHQITGMFSTFAQAFENIEKQLIKRDETDTELDIDILKQTLEREGLLDSDFDIKLN